MAEFTWVSVAQPLYVARTGMERSLLRRGPNKTEREWQDTLESAESGLDTFCRPERVYGLGMIDDAGEDARPAYLTASGIYHDTGRSDSEVYVTGDDPARTEADARKWVSDWLERAKTRVSNLDAD
ncbi:hypothetical protein [Micromonospora sp. CNB394]|uniref:hypothetical protein n=1 Tax=Micromonospora sp. CNB394 TaxID=1169151 RepID=UPI0003702589|nr:hypothetical protein [Micromonospora sp. CNB394]